MKLHEYQSKELFSRFGIPVPTGKVITTVEDIEKISQDIKGPPWVVKAQVHAGGRGKGGGVKVVNSLDEMKKASETILNKPLITKQTGSQGTNVHQLLIEEGVEIDRELYLAMTVDRSVAKPVMIFSQAGGMEIEEVAENTPELVFKESIDPDVGWASYLGRSMVYKLDPLPAPETVRELITVMGRLYNLFIDLDCSLAEINPLVITKEGKALAIDAKINIDDNALYRQKEMKTLDDPREKDPLELEAEKSNLNYIRLDGNTMRFEWDGADKPLSELLATMVNKGFRVLWFREVPLDLEEAFMRLTATAGQAGGTLAAPAGEGATEG